jgi:hypothetical protein
MKMFLCRMPCLCGNQRRTQDAYHQMNEHNYEEWERKFDVNSTYVIYLGSASYCNVLLEKTPKPKKRRK